MRNFHLPGRSPVYATNGMVATSHPLAASVALDTLKQGGTAADAAIAGAILLGLCEPHMTGLGGDLFALVSPPGSNDIVALNGSGRAPAATNADSLRQDGATKIDPRSAAAITIPGAVAGFCALAERFGSIGLDRCLAPAIRYAENGVPVAPRVAFDWAGSADLLRGPGRSWYLDGGTAPATGQVFRHSGQVEALKKIAAGGRDAFYTGAVADDIVAALTSLGGVHDASDLAATKATWHDPISGNYRGTELVEHPPNGQGATAILLAGILSQFEISGLDPNGAARLHLEIEATKLAYDARNRFLSDPEHMGRLDHMLSSDTAERLAGLIDPDRAMRDPAPLVEEVHRDTVLITVVDKDGMYVSLIYSIFHDFGSGLATDKFGILLHNRGAGFSLVDGHPNEIGPGKRPMHTIIPGMLRKDGVVTGAFGVMGGQYQSTGHAHVLSNLVDFGMDPQEALDSPRVFTEDGEVRVELGVAAPVVSELAERGHTIVRPERPIGGAQAILIDPDNGVLIGASDPRKDGCAIGY